MDVLVRELRHAADGTLESTDKEFSGETLTIGSAPDQTIQLIGRDIAPRHVTIVRVEAGIRLESQRGQFVTINKQAVTSAELQLGSKIELGAHRLCLIPPPSGFDIAIEVELSDKVDSSEFEGAFQTDLRQTILNKRSLAWAFASAVFVLFLLIPLLVLSLHHHGINMPGLPSDKLWLPGPLSAVHKHAIGNDCSACHQTLFKRVSDSACMTCHVTVADHVTSEHLSQTTFGDKPRCATCHREHLEPNSQLIIADNTQCKDCHAKSTTAFGALNVKPVAGFSSDSHPEFTLHLLKSAPLSNLKNAGSELVWHEELAVPTLATEDSHLKFPHDIHLDPAHVLRLNDSKPLSCMDCHELSTNGERFIPITMKSRCISCHDLSFDIADPTRQLPHAAPREVIKAMQEYYAAKFIDPNAFKAHAVERRRLPGREEEAEAGCTGAPLFCARQETLKQAEVQFNVRGCITCHTVIDNKAENMVDRFQVMPVRLTNNYYPGAHFKHRSHLIQGNLTGDDACQSCHHSKQSGRSQDVLVQGIDSCLACHGNRISLVDNDLRSVGGKVAAHSANIKLGCIECHNYHPQP